MLKKNTILLMLFVTLTIFSQNEKTINLGKVKSGELVSFFQISSGDWGIKITGESLPCIFQNKPVQIQISLTGQELTKISMGYESIEEKVNEIICRKEIKYENSIFNVTDIWSIKDTTLSVNREIQVVGNSEGGFSSSLILKIDPVISWNELNLMSPSAIYGDPSHNGEYSPGGTINYAKKKIVIREDAIPAPLFAISFSNGSSVSILNPSPDGTSTFDETKLVEDKMIDGRFKFGAIGVWQNSDSPVEFGYRFPGSVELYQYKALSALKPRNVQRYHPITEGIFHRYDLKFRVGHNESFREASRNSWRWAWSELKPSVELIDVDQMRRVLTDHMVDQALTINGRSNIPFAVATFDTNQVQWNRTMTVMGFVSKNLECADQLLRESDRDKSERGRKMRELALSIINPLVQALSKIPLEATGYDIATGKPWTGEHQEWLAHWLRNPSEGMRTLIRTFRRERSNGKLYLDWFNWVKSYADWLIIQQREDGSFPRRWEGGTGKVLEETGTTSYCPVPLLVMMTEETGNYKYIEAAINAAEYIWANYGSRGLYIGGTNDNPNITDKEAGMLSLEAFLSLYEFTKEMKWLERAKAAADYTETWMWIWNLPMPIDADDSKLHWKKGVSTIGLQGITARGVGGADEYMDWSAPSYAKLYKYTNDEHYLDVARILLHGTKSMVAIPNRLYDMKAIGFQQEHWRMGPGRTGRGLGGHRFWLPWISANHLYSITAMEEFVPEIYKKLVEGN